MTNEIGIGHVEAHEKLTARLYWKRTTDTGYNDAGNVREFVDATTATTVTRARAEDGARYVNDEQSDLIHEGYTFLLDEHSPEQEVLLRKARELSDRTQAAVEGTTATISDAVQNKWYPIGAYGIANVAVAGSLSGSLVEGTDYEIDTEDGMIRILDGGISDGEDVTLTFDQPSITFQRFETQYDALFFCDAIIELHNQYSKRWLKRAAFQGYLNITEWPTQTGEFGTYRVKLTPSAAVTWEKRTKAANLTSAPEVSEAAGMSSSSSSSNSSSSGHSSSSSSS